MKEEWKTVSYLSPDYQVSNIGKVRKQLNSDEYKEVVGTISNGVRMISCNGKQFPVHRLVADAFLDNPDNLPLVIHKDRNKLNNDVSNLKWSTRTDSLTASLREGVTSKPLIYCKERDKLYGSLRTASYATSVQQELISWAISEGQTVCGLTFMNVEPGDPDFIDHEIKYVSFEDVKKVAVDSKTVSAMIKKLHT